MDELDAKKIINRFAKGFADGNNVIATSEEYYKTMGMSIGKRAADHKIYTREEIEEILITGNPDELKELSLSFFYTSGFYRRLLSHYATILYYTPLIIPHMVKNKKRIRENKYKDKYYAATEFVNKINFEAICRHFALKTLTEGGYYGIIKEDGDNISIQDLPFKYCRSLKRTLDGVDIIEFDITWFNKIRDPDLRINTLKSFPKVIRDAYRDFGRKNGSKWATIPPEYGVHFNLVEERPFFACVIPEVLNFEDYINLEKERDMQDLKAIISQEIPHVSSGDLVLEPEEALTFHEGLKKIANGNKNLDAITTYGNIKVQKIQDNDATVKNNLEKIESILYSQSGVSKQLFSAETNTSLEKSIQNDMALMKLLADRFSIWLEHLLNLRFADKYITFDAEILPVGPYNSKDYLQQSINMAQYGYSFIIPSIAMGLEQNQMIDLKSLETDVLRMQDKLVPLQSSYTSSAKQEGAKGSAKDSKESSQNAIGKSEAEINQAKADGASKEESELSDKTLRNKESL